MDKTYLLQKFASGMHYIRIDDETARQFLEEGHKRVVCTLNDQIDFHCAIMPKKESGYFVNIGAAICKKLKIKAGAEVKAKFSTDTTEYQFEMPEELQEVLVSDPEAMEIFHTLTPGNQRGIIYLVTLLKTSQKRIERALMIADKLKCGISTPRLILKRP